MSDQTKPDVVFVHKDYKRHIKWRDYGSATIFKEQEFDERKPVVLLDPRYIDWIREARAFLTDSIVISEVSVNARPIRILAQLDALEKER